jgi:hypothetical protein
LIKMIVPFKKISLIITMEIFMKNNKKTYNNNNNKILFKIHMIYRIMSFKKIL